jgi:hypothetical protein
VLTLSRLCRCAPHGPANDGRRPLACMGGLIGKLNILLKKKRLHHSQELMPVLNTL